MNIHVNSEISEDLLLDAAVTAAQTAGQHALANSARRNQSVMRAAHDVKLALDIECQEIAETMLLERFPEHRVLGEEHTALEHNTGAANSDYEWIIDPIDGTVNFSHNMRQWCCSIAVRRGADVVAGAVYAPALDELYTATAHGPALLNGKAIRVSTVARAADCMVNTGMDRHDDPDIPPYELFRRIADNTQKARIMGSAALDLCHVARGEADAYFECGIFIWDVAAAGLVIQRAGGRTEVMGLKKDGRLIYLGSNGLIHEELRTILNIPTPANVLSRVDRTFSI